MGKHRRRRIHCEECTREFETTRPNTKFCPVCRFEKDLTFINSFRQQCEVCEEWFAPIARGEKWCGSCRYEPQKYGVTECGICRKEKPRVRPMLELCVSCATHPDHRGPIMRSLRRKQQEARSV